MMAVSGAGGGSIGGPGGGIGGPGGGIDGAGPATRTCLARRRSGHSLGDERQPMIELNTTPLIDVMLVLLVMLIITIPSQSHQVAIDLPGKTVEHREINPLRNRLKIDAGGAARWNGAVIGDRALAAKLRDVAAMDRPAEVHFEPAAAARYERVDAVLALASQAGVATLGFVGNDRYRDSF